MRVRWVSLTLPLFVAAHAGGQSSARTPRDSILETLRAHGADTGTRAGVPILFVNGSRDHATRLATWSSSAWSAGALSNTTGPTRRSPESA